ncbi:MAG: hypothetical protein HRU20_24880 [Pseudomonadales bacterium]|nr:hypothetical protein [Pseudomonadales bacterium]
MAAKASFSEIQSCIDPLANAISDVSHASNEQNEAIRQIVLGIADIDRSVDENRQLAESSSGTAGELRENALALMKLVKDMNELQEELS